MKFSSKIFLIIHVFVCAICVSLSTSLSYANNIGAYSAPTVTFFYAALFDEICSIKASYKIDPMWNQELNDRLSQWKKLWSRDGNRLLNEAINIVGRPFTQNHFDVPLSLCSFPSMSSPLIVNVRYSLKNFTDHPILDDVTISTVEHELLHNYIDSFLPEKTPLLIKYKSEPKMVIGHLHLFALQKATYLALGWKYKLDEIIKKDKSLPNNDYKRAWEIVNEKEDYSSFISELKLDYKK
jgi:hypothetical protein